VETFKLSSDQLYIDNADARGAGQGSTPRVTRLKWPPASARIHPVWRATFQAV